MNYYVYLYLDPRKKGNFEYGKHSFTNEPFYVGKGNGKRFIAHLQPKNLKHNSPKNQKINKIIKCGEQPIIIKFSENLPEEEAFLIETDLIAAIGRKDQNKGPLLNLYDGGYGSSKSIETRKKISETKKQMFASGQLIHPMLGKTHTKESKIKMSQSHIGHKLTEAHKLKLQKIRNQIKCHFTKKWKVINPNGESQIVYGLGEFCRNNGLSQSHMFRVAVGQRHHHKGWTCEKLD